MVVRRTRRTRRGRNRSRKLAHGRSRLLIKRSKYVASHPVINYYQLNINNLPINANYVATNLTRIVSGWTPIFGASSDDGHSAKALLRSISFDFIVRMDLDNNVSDSFSFFIVSVRKLAANFIDYPTAGLVSLTTGTDYISNDSGAYLNPRIFKIHYFRRFVLSNTSYDTAGVGQINTASTTNYRRMRGRIPVGKMITAPRGNWSALQCPYDPTTNYFMICFHTGLNASPYSFIDGNIRMSVDTNAI